MKYAASQSYEPDTIGIFGGLIHYRYKEANRIHLGSWDCAGCDDTNIGAREFNDKLYEFLRSCQLLRRCVIIFGNYQAVGESNTFVNSKYGYLRSAILLPGCKLTPEQRYQFYLRCCFIMDRFNTDISKLDKKDVTKFIIGTNDSIKDAETYETQNDDLVQDLIDNPENTDDIVFDCSSNPITTSGGGGTISVTRRSIPVQFKIEDNDNENVVALVEIMKKENGRTEDDKAGFMTNLIAAIESFSVILVDHNKPRINLSLYVLKEFRCFKTGNIESSYRFKNYRDHFEQKMPYKNGDIKKNECEIHCCVNKYILEVGQTKFINNPNTFYMTFAY
jgi:hypothetical protein